MIPALVTDDSADVSVGSTYITLGEHNTGGSAQQPCEDPISLTVELHKKTGRGPFAPYTVLKSLIVVSRTNNKQGREVGGYCAGKSYETPKLLKTYASTLFEQLFVLPDKTALLQIGDGKFQRALLLRFNRDLSVRFKSSGFAIIATAAYEKLVDDEGILRAQKTFCRNSTDPSRGELISTLPPIDLGS